jgi:hypothetical protein
MMSQDLSRSQLCDKHNEVKISKTICWANSFIATKKYKKFKSELPSKLPNPVRKQFLWIDEMANWQNDMLTKRQVDEMATWRNDNLAKWQVDEAT